MTTKIPTFIINLKSREDRFLHSKDQFKGREEFELNIVEAISHKFGNLGLWHTIKHIIADLANEEEFVLICEDDHLFTSDYDKRKLLDAIVEAKTNLADILFGGVSWFEDSVQISEHLFTVKKFSGTQFTIIFKKFYKTILDAPFGPQDIADAKIARLSDSIFFMNPFISVQKEFGYSDATEINNGTQRVQSLFFKSAVRAKILSNIRNHYLNSFDIENIVNSIDVDDNWTIPTFILNLPERIDRKQHIVQQFVNKPEFDLQFVESVKHKIGAYGHWQSIRSIIQLAIEKDEDVIIICEDDHAFMHNYSSNKFLKDIFLAHSLGCEYLSGGTGKFELAVPVTENLFWVDHLLSTQFIILYKKAFQKILDAPFGEDVIGDIKLSKLTNNKMLIVPPISFQQDIGNSDITSLHNDNKGLVNKMFNLTYERLIYMKLVYETYKSGIVRTLSNECK